MKIELLVKREMFRFESKQQWINKAQSWFQNSGVRSGHHICIDSMGRICQKGLEFSRAENENTYPIIVYEIEGI